VRENLLSFVFDDECRPEEDNVENYQNRIVYDITKNLSLAKPTVTWDDICGMEKEKYAIQQDVLMPIILSESRMEVVINSRDILLYGVFKDDYSQLRVDSLQE